MPFVAFAVIVLGLASEASPADIAELLRWEGTATLSPNRGPGEEDFLLIAAVAWDRTAPRDASRYAIRVALPDGLVALRPVTPSEAPRSTRLTIPIPTRALRNVRPEAVIVGVTIVGSGGSPAYSNELRAGIENFPTPATGEPPPDRGPFGWGTPLAPSADHGVVLPRTGPDGLSFARIPGSGRAGFFLATTEVTNRQAALRLKDYNPAAGRSDEFSLEAPDQPAIGLTPARAREYVAALGSADRTGLKYRLPSRPEWLHAARAGRSTAFWWGDAPREPAGANFLGPEPALQKDSTARSLPKPEPPTFQANPWGLFHTFGNVAEWTTDPSGGFARLGGHFRTEPESPLPEPVVADSKSLGDDSYVGVRPAFDLSAETGSALAQRALESDPQFARVRCRFDPDRATVALTGAVAEGSLRRLADRRISRLWWVAAVQNEVTTPTDDPRLLVHLGGPVGPARVLTPLGKRIDAVPVAARWSNPLPVSGSDWWVNVYLPGGGHISHMLPEPRRGTARRIEVLLDRAQLGAANLQSRGPLSVALSLGAAAPSPTDSRIVSNVISIQAPF
jgi:hypothetical protein